MDLTTLIPMIVAAVCAWLGAGLVTRAPRRLIQVGMGLPSSSTASWARCWLHWLVLGVVLYAAVLMLLSARVQPVTES